MKKFNWATYQMEEEGLHDDPLKGGHRFRSTDNRFCVICDLSVGAWIHSLEAIEKAMPEFGTVPEEPHEEEGQQVLPMGLPGFLDEG